MAMPCRISKPQARDEAHETRDTRDRLKRRERATKQRSNDRSTKERRTAPPTHPNPLAHSHPEKESKYSLKRLLIEHACIDSRERERERERDLLEIGIIHKERHRERPRKSNTLIPGCDVINASKAVRGSVSIVRDHRVSDDVKSSSGSSKIRKDLEQELVRNHRHCRRLIDQRSNHRHRQHCLLHP